MTSRKLKFPLHVVSMTLWLLLVGACRDFATSPRDIAETKDRPRETSIIFDRITPPGRCAVTLPTTNSGGLVSYDTGCTFPDSALVRVAVSGQLAVATNPGHTCCFQASYPYVGTYGPMGGGSAGNWMVLFTRTVIQFGNGSSTQSNGQSYGFSLGSSAATVTLFEGSFVNRQGGRVTIDRNPASGSGSCTSSPAPSPPACGPGGSLYSYYADMYVTSGTQQLTVEWIRRTLLITAQPTPVFLGDTVVFLVKSSDNASLSGREWIWKDSLNTTYSVPCSSSEDICKFAPPASGKMFVRARVGANAFFEQAEVAVEVRPLCLSSLPLLDNTNVRRALLAAFDLSNPDDPDFTKRAERGLYFFQLSNGKIVARYPDPEVRTNCGNASGAPTDGTSVLLGGAHTHPFAPRDTVQCTLPNGSTYRVGYDGGPSQDDLEIQLQPDLRNAAGQTVAVNPMYSKPAIVIDKERVYVTWRDSTTGWKQRTESIPWSSGSCSWRN